MCPVRVTHRDMKIQIVENAVGMNVQDVGSGERLHFPISFNCLGGCICIEQQYSAV